MELDQTNEPLQKKGSALTPSSQAPSSSARVSDGTEGVGLSTIPKEAAENVKVFRESDEGKKLVAWVLSEFEKAAGARTQFETDWRRNLNYWRRHQGLGAGSTLAQKVANAGNTTPDQAKRRKKLTINRIRSFARSEHSKFISQEPTISVVPASSEDQDFRAATAAEQAWRSLSDVGNLEQHMSDGMWWKVLTGNGFIKTYWDGQSLDPVSGELGIVRYGAVTPFHLFVPDLREPSLEDQPFIINGYTKTLEWARQRYPKELEGCEPGSLTLGRKIDNPATQGITEPPHSVVILEAWVKPGATKHLPEGGLLHLVGQQLVGITRNGIPYQHGNYPYAHLGHLYSGAFYRACSIDDLIELQDEYNAVRSDINHAFRVAGRPQLVIQKGSLAGSKWTNEAGLLIELNPGFSPPVPVQTPELPQYGQQQQDRILADFEDISGQHEVSRGQAPGRGVTAGTAIAYLQESDDQYLTPQYRADEAAYEKIARQTLELFVQYVPNKRKIRSLGADRAFDTMLLSGADIRNGTDVRVEKGSTISTSQVARRAEIKELVGLGIITPPQALDMLEMGGVERLRETVDIAKSKAQRENIKLQNLTVVDIAKAEDAAVQAAMQQATPEALLEMAGGMEGVAAEGLEAEQLVTMMQDQVRAQMPALVPADDFDLHTLHIDVHNQFRMSQAYEQLDDQVKAQFEKHILEHETYLQQQQAQQMMSASGFPEGNPPSEEQIAEQIAAGGMSMPAPQMPEPQLGEPGQEPTRADQFKAGVAPQTPGV